tara:strand:- start:15584 stop:16264 length:681 start_codon:yes stop_codon:yes gene_type:complete
MGLRAPGVPAVAQAPKPKIPEFDVQRKKVEQRVNADAQGQQDAMARRFAAQGMLNSGAAIKQQGIVANQATQNREDALQQVDAAEMGEQQRRQEVVDQRDFASNEAKLGRDFQGNESALARALQTSQFDRNFDQQGQQFKDQFGLSKDQFGLSKEQFAAERADQQLNIAASTANLKGDDRKRYNAYLISVGRPPLPDIEKQRPMRSSQPSNVYDRRADSGNTTGFR